MEVKGEQKEPYKAKSKEPILYVVYIFMGLFLLVMGYFTYFMVARSNDVINSTYNKRQEVLAERVIRGKILSADREILARTIIDDEEGTETREYPFGDVFAHAVGRFSKGKSGIEQTDNIHLLTSNINSFEKMYHDLIAEKSLGNNVVTTFNSELQQIAYDAMGEHRGAVIVMEPSTGKILTMVSKPSYDPNDIDDLWTELIEDEETESPLLNRATQGLYPPGSTFKLLTALTYMRDNTNYGSYEYDCDGSIEYNNMVIHCYNNKVHGEVDLTQSLAKSCNASFALIGKSLDLNHYKKVCEEFLFNQDLPVSMVHNNSSFQLNANSVIKEVMQTAIGQGRTLITPLHNAMIASTIANGGVMMKPYMVDHIENAYGNTVNSFTPQINSKPMTVEEASYLGEMMHEVVENGTATKLKDVKVEVAGKTGSADQANNKAHAWFIGYAPVDKPEIAVSVIVESVGTASEYAVPIARKIFDAYFK